MACWCWITLVFPSRGKASVGVTRQDSESLGKVGNGGRGDLLLYRSASQLADGRVMVLAVSLGRGSGVPAEVCFQTNPEIALSLLDPARVWGIPHRCVVILPTVPREGA
jgi:hypothetical protein